MSYILDIKILKNTISYRISQGFFFRSTTVEENSLALTFRDEQKSEIIKALEGFKEKYSVRDVRIYLPFYLCLYSMVDLPVRKKSDIEGALEFELEKTLPLPASEYVSDYSVTEKDKISSKILVLSVKKDFLSRVLGYVSEVGMDVISFRCDLMEVLEGFSREKKMNNFILVYGESGDCSIAAIKEGKLKALKRMPNLSLLGREVGSLRKSLNIDSVFLSGDITGEIRAEIGVSYSDMQVSRPGWKKVRSFYFEFLKAGLGGGRRSRHSLYFRVAAVVSVIMIITGFSLPIYRDSATLGEVDRRIDEIKEKTSGLMEKRKHLESVKERLRFLNTALSSKDMPLRVMGELSNILSDDVWIIGLSIDEKGLIELRGFAVNAAQLVELLEKSDMFKNVVFSAPILSSGDKTRFSIKMEIEQ